MKSKKLVVSGLGIQTTEETARKIDSYLSDLPKTKQYEFRRKGVVADTEINVTERTDISYITTRAVDRDGEIVDPDGFILTDYRANPVVLYGHNQERPTGKNLWIKPHNDGLLAKTLYPERPDKFVGDWLPDFVWAMVQADVLRGKSVGFLPLECRDPTPEEIEKFPSVQNVITKSLLLEYSIVAVPSNPQALIESIGKGIGLEHWGYKVVGKVPTKAPAKPKPPVRKPVNVDWAKAIGSLRLDPERIAEEAVRRVLSRWEV